MREEYDNERPNFDDEEYFDRSGCGQIVAALGIIALFWIVVGTLFLFTK